MDLPFAVFFLHNMIKQTHSVLYSSLDELHSLDPELSKSLHFIKVRGVSEKCGNLLTVSLTKYTMSLHVSADTLMLVIVLGL